MGERRRGVFTEKAPLRSRCFVDASGVAQNKDARAVAFGGEAPCGEAAAVFIELSKGFVEVALDAGALRRPEQSEFIAQGQGRGSFCSWRRSFVCVVSRRVGVSCATRSGRRCR